MAWSSSISKGLRSQRKQPMDMRVHLDLRQYVNMAPSPPPITPMSVSKNVLCFCSQSGGSSQPLLTHEMGQSMISMRIQYVYIFNQVKTVYSYFCHIFFEHQSRPFFALANALLSLLPLKKNSQLQQPYVLQFSLVFWA